ncbi:MAG: tetratricopeptide repeat protein [Lentimonas sp.]
MRHLCIILFTLLSAQLSTRAETFALVDTGPGSPDFRKRFMGSFGINSAIEPQIIEKDRPLYESIEPHLENNPNRAIQLVEQGINSGSNAAFDFLLGSLYYIQGNFSKAEASLRTALKKFPDFRRAHRNLSLIYIQREDYQRSVQHLVRVIELGGNDGQSYSMLAYAYLNQEKYQAALTAYQMARMFLPDSLDVRRGEAQCLLMTHQYEAAIALFDELIIENPHKQDFWLFQANAFLAVERFVDTIANLEIAHTVAPPKAASLYLLGDLYTRRNSYKQAITNYKAAVKSDPNILGDTALLPLTRLMQMGLFEEAQDYLSTLNSVLQTELTPKQTAQKNVFTAQLQIEIGDPAQGIQQLKSILETDPLNIDGLLLIGSVYLKQDNYAQASFYYERATKIPEAQVRGLVGLARTAVKESKFKDALAYLEKSQSIEPRNDVASFAASIRKAIAAE